MLSDHEGTVTPTGVEMNGTVWCFKKCRQRQFLMRCNYVWWLCQEILKSPFQFPLPSFRSARMTWYSTAWILSELHTFFSSLHLFEVWLLVMLPIMTSCRNTESKKGKKKIKKWRNKKDRGKEIICELLQVHYVIHCLSHTVFGLLWLSFLLWLFLVLLPLCSISYQPCTGVSWHSRKLNLISKYWNPCNFLCTLASYQLPAGHFFCETMQWLLALQTGAKSIPSNVVHGLRQLSYIIVVDWNRYATANTVFVIAGRRGRWHFRV